MPAPVDLTGARFGSLVAESRTRHTDGKTAWVCRCDCGRTTTVPTIRLSSVADDNPRAIRACEACRSRQCAICGALYLKSGSATTCGADACRLEYRRAANAKYSAASEERAPGQKYQRDRQRVANIRSNHPERYAEMLEAGRESQKRRRAKMDDIDRILRRAWSRDYYAQHRDSIRAKFSAWLDNMPPGQRADWDQRRADSSRAYLRRRALAKMAETAAQLINRNQPKS